MTEPFRKAPTMGNLFVQCPHTRNFPVKSSKKKNKKKQTLFFDITGTPFILGQDSLAILKLFLTKTRETKRYTLIATNVVLVYVLSLSFIFLHNPPSSIKKFKYWTKQRVNYLNTRPPGHLTKLLCIVAAFCVFINLVHETQAPQLQA